MEAIITAIIGLIGGGTAGAVVAGLFAKNKVKAEVNRETSTAWKEFAEKMETRQNELDDELKLTRDELKRTNRRLDRYGKRIIYLTEGVDTLVKQILNDGKEPCWTPNEWNPDEE